MEIARIIQRHISNSSQRAQQRSSFELARFPPEDIEAILSCLEQEKKIAGNKDPCGPTCNVASGFSLLLLMRVLLLIQETSTFCVLLPIQMYHAISYLRKRRLKALYNEILIPNVAMRSWTRAMTASVKAPLSLVRKSLQDGSALCVNRAGQLKLMHSGYVIFSHVWGETMAWQTPNSWGPVDLSLRKNGLRLDHLHRFFDNCKTPITWAWLDAIAIPEFLEDMSNEEKEETEALRAHCINNLRNVYNRADCAVVLDTCLLRLHTVSVLDVAVVLVLSRWITRLWCFTESYLVPSVKLQIANRAFDLDEVIDFLTNVTNNDQDRYYPLLGHLARARPKSLLGVPILSNVGERVQDAPPSAHIYLATEHRATGVDVDQVRALYPMLDLQWEPGWTLEHGLAHMRTSSPESSVYLDRYVRRRNL